jgi:hypothetical protein
MHCAIFCQHKERISLIPSAHVQNIAKQIALKTGYYVTGRVAGEDENCQKKRQIIFGLAEDNPETSAPRNYL